jgi:ribosomal protein L29
MDWSYATGEFLNTGETAGLKPLVMGYIKPDLARTKGMDQNANALRNVVKKLDNITDFIKFNRGKDIVAELDNLDNDIDSINDSDIFPPLKNLLKEMQNKASRFSKDGTNNHNLIEASGWALDHGLIPQCVTILQEGIITAICNHLNLDHSNPEQRELINQAIKIKNDHIEETQWKSPASDNRFKTREIMKIISRLKNLDKEFKNLSNIRNDINHCGFSSNPMHISKIKKEINRILDIMKKIWPELANAGTER